VVRGGGGGGLTDGLDESPPPPPTRSNRNQEPPPELEPTTAAAVPPVPPLGTPPDAQPPVEQQLGAQAGQPGQDGQAQPNATSPPSGPVQIVAHEYKMEAIGRRIKWAKKKHTWTFTATGQKTVVALKASWFSGRRTVYVNETAVYDQILTGSEQKTFHYTAPLSSVIEIHVAAQARGKYTLSINGKLFEELEQQPYSMESRGRDMLQSPATTPRGGQDVKVDALFDNLDEAGNGRALKAAIIEAIKSDPEIQEILKLPAAPAEASQVLQSNFNDIPVDSEGKISREEYQQACVQILLSAPPDAAGVGPADLSNQLEAAAQDGTAEGGSRRKKKKKDRHAAAGAGMDEAAWGGDAFAFGSSAPAEDGTMPPQSPDEDGDAWAADFGAGQKTIDFPKSLGQGEGSGSRRRPSNTESGGGFRDSGQDLVVDEDDPFADIEPELSGPWRFDQKHPFTVLPPERIRLLQQVWLETAAIPVGSYGYGDPYAERNGGAGETAALTSNRAVNDAAFGQSGPDSTDAWAESFAQGKREAGTTRRSRRHHKTGK